MSVLFKVYGDLVNEFEKFCTTLIRNPLEAPLIMKNPTSLAAKFLSIISLVAVSQSAHAQVIGFNFQGFTPPLQSSETAGVVPQTNFNNFGDNKIYTNLVDNSGTATTTDVTYSTDGGGFYVYSNIYPVTPNERLVGGFVFSTPGVSVDVNVSSIPYAQYDVYLYGLGDTPGRIQEFTITLADTSTISFFYQSADKNALITGSNNNPFALGSGLTLQTATANADYVVFRGLTDANIAISARAYDFNSGTGTYSDSYSFFSGGQIVAVPEGSTWLLASIGLLVVVVNRRRLARQE